MCTRILIADDHQILLQGLRALLNEEPGFEVIAEAVDGRGAVRLSQEQKPDVAVIDVTMQGLNGIDAARQICKGTDIKVVALSAHNEPHIVQDIFAAGARGYVLKEDALEELSDAIRHVMAGELFLSKRLLSRTASEASSSMIADLTPREREVLQLMAEGESTKEIAFRLRLSTKTIETHRRSLMEKLQMYSVSELTKCAICEGLTTTGATTRSTPTAR
jgi:two-component system response regulator NreC